MPLNCPKANGGCESDAQAFRIGIRRSRPKKKNGSIDAHQRIPPSTSGQTDHRVGMQERPTSPPTQLLDVGMLALIHVHVYVYGRVQKINGRLAGKMDSRVVHNHWQVNINRIQTQRVEESIRMKAQQSTYFSSVTCLSWIVCGEECEPLHSTSRTSSSALRVSSFNRFRYSQWARPEDSTGKILRGLALESQ